MYLFFIQSYRVDRQVHMMVTSVFISLIQQPKKEKPLLTFAKENGLFDMSVST